VIIDTSALVAILEDEPERARFVRMIADAPVRRISAATYVESSIVLAAKRGRSGVHDFMLFVARAGIRVEPVDEEDARTAIDAYQRYGKGFGPAGLNYGDIFAYALAHRLREPLLFKGDDFTKTDSTAAR
jgi:ribonuclease VapC